MLKRGMLIPLLLLALLLAARASTTRAAVTLASFVGEWRGNVVILEWETGSETEHLAFHVWRSTENLTINMNGQIDETKATQLTESPIISDASCSSNGHLYDLTDDTVSPSIGTYYYYLESVNCSGTGSEFEGAATGGGLVVSRPGAPSPTLTPSVTRTATATRTRTPTATPSSQPGETPSPTNTPIPTETPSPTNTPDDGDDTGQAQATNTPPPTATNTPQNNPSAPTATFTATRAANQPSTATSTRAAAAPASPTRQIAVAPPATSTRPPSQPTQAPAPSNPQPPVNTPVLGTGSGPEVTPTTATFTDDGGAGGGVIEDPGEPESFDDLIETTEVAVAPEPEVDVFTEEAVPAPGTGGGVTSGPPIGDDPQAMSVLPAAATPTIASMLAQQLPVSPQAALVAAEVQSDPLDRVIQVVIALILLGAVALIGFIGWTLVRQQ